MGLSDVQLEYQKIYVNDNGTNVAPAEDDDDVEVQNLPLIFVFYHNDLNFLKYKTNPVIKSTKQTTWNVQL